MEIDKRSLIQLFGQDPNIILSEVARTNSLLQRELYLVTNDCPTLDNKINCSVCTHECKLRMQQLEQSKEDTSPEYPPAVIYY
jgi:hypothetical protein